MNWEALARRLPLRLDEDARRLASTDCWPQALWWSEEERRAHWPAAVARPETPEQAAFALRFAADAGIPVVARGGGSGVCGAAIPERPETLVVETLALDRILEVREGPDASARTQAGILGGALEDRLSVYGLSTGHSPASLAVSSLGGWIATASHGHFSSRLGGFAGRVRRLRAALYGGELREFSGAGAWSGSEGTLGLVLEAEFGLVAPPMTAPSSFEFRSFAEGLAFLESLYREGRGPLVCRLYDGPDRKMLGPDSRTRPPGRLLARALRHGGALRRLLEGALRPRPLAVVLDDEREPSGLRPQTAAAEAGGRPLGPAPAERWWRRRYQPGFDRVLAWRERGVFADTIDLWAPWPAASAVYERVGEALGRRAFWTCHASHPDRAGACLYFSFAGSASTEEGSRARHQTAWSEAIDAAVAAGGAPNHHHGWGIAKRPWLAPQAERQAARAALDPARRMNPGKQSPDPEVLRAASPA